MKDLIDTTDEWKMVRIARVLAEPDGRKKRPHGEIKRVLYEFYDALHEEGELTWDAFKAAVDITGIKKNTTQKMLRSWHKDRAVPLPAMPAGVYTAHITKEVRQAKFKESESTISKRKYI